MNTAESIYQLAQTEAGIEKLVADHAEGLHFDFKAAPGKPIKQEEGLKTKVLKAAGAFANADGGVIVIGVNDKTRDTKPFADRVAVAEYLQRHVTTKLTPERFANRSHPSVDGTHPLAGSSVFSGFFDSTRC